MADRYRAEEEHEIWNIGAKLNTADYIANMATDAKVDYTHRDSVINRAIDNYV